MPVHKGHDSNGSYYQWGHHGKKYYFSSTHGAASARRRAGLQGQAAYSNGYRGKK